MLEDSNLRRIGGHGLIERINRLQTEIDQLRSNLADPENTAITAAPTARANVRSIITARRMRTEVFGADLFADPLWDILLELYAAKLAERRIAVSELLNAAAVAATTGLRWIEKLVRLGWASRNPDAFDARRVLVELTPEGAAKMEHYFERVEGGVATI